MNDERMYDVYVILEKGVNKGKRFKMNGTPMTHQQAITFKSKMTDRSDAYYLLVEA